MGAPAPYSSSKQVISKTDSRMGAKTTIEFKLRVVCDGYYKYYVNPTLISLDIARKCIQSGDCLSQSNPLEFCKVANNEFWPNIGFINANLEVMSTGTFAEMPFSVVAVTASTVEQHGDDLVIIYDFSYQIEDIFLYIVRQEMLILELKQWVDHFAKKELNEVPRLRKCDPSPEEKSWYDRLDENVQRIKGSTIAKGEIAAVTVTFYLMDYIANVTMPFPIFRKEDIWPRNEVVQEMLLGEKVIHCRPALGTASTINAIPGKLLSDTVRHTSASSKLFEQAKDAIEIWKTMGEISDGLRFGTNIISLNRINIIKLGKSPLGEFGLFDIAKWMIIIGQSATLEFVNPFLNDIRDDSEIELMLSELEPKLTRMTSVSQRSSFSGLMVANAISALIASDLGLEMKHTRHGRTAKTLAISIIGESLDFLVSLSLISVFAVSELITLGEFTIVLVCVGPPVWMAKRAVGDKMNEWAEDASKIDIEQLKKRNCEMKATAETTGYLRRIVELRALLDEIYNGNISNDHVLYWCVNSKKYLHIVPSAEQIQPTIVSLPHVSRSASFPDICAIDVRLK